ncbi:MAG: FtsW/RodA/SpoVE family cell cycle protein [Fimbriimonadaceae bacterium]
MAATTSLGTRRTGLPHILKTISHYDWWLILATLALLTFGMMSLYSIDVGTKSSYFKRQFFFLAVGAVPFLFFLTTRPATLRKFYPILYWFNVALLLVVMRAGTERGGDAQRWLIVGPFQFQPSELSKLLIVITLSAYWATRRKEEIKQARTFFISFLHVALPMILVFKQPHLGATLAIFATWLTVSLVMGSPGKFAVMSVILGLFAMLVAVNVPGILSDYQLDRIRGLFNPNASANGFQVDRALTTIGSGGLTGKGWKKGDLTASNYVPEAQTDFIITVLGEEGGLIGCGLLLLVYGVFFFRMWLIMIRAEDHFHKGLLGGVLMIFAFHTIVNLCMVIRLLPVVGLWLPFMSSGGTALWLCLACVGLVLNIKAREGVAKF